MKAFVSGFNSVNAAGPASFEIQSNVVFFDDAQNVINAIIPATLDWGDTPNAMKDKISSAIVAGCDPSWGTITKNDIVMPDFTKG